MSRNLCFLNLLLLALAVFAGSRLRIRWRAEKAREAAEFPPTAPSIPPAAFTAVRVPPVTRPVTYVAIAQKDLFDPSRNPDLPVEIILPPPKPPIPPLPVYHGAMNLGDGPMAILSVNSGAPQQATRPGEMIGPFKLIDVTRQDLVLEWNGEMIRASLDDHTNAVAARPLEAGSVRPDPPVPQMQAQVEVPTAIIRSGGTSAGSKNCAAGDGTPFGTAQEGFRKLEIATPFGKACFSDSAAK